MIRSWRTLLSCAALLGLWVLGGSPGVALAGGKGADTRAPAKSPSQKKPPPKTGAIVYPRLTKFVKAPYPEAMRKAGKEGVVKLALSLDDKGNVLSVTVVRSAGALFDAAARAAALQWKFSPATLDGKPIASKIPISYPFKLKNSGVMKGRAPLKKTCEPGSGVSCPAKAPLKPVVRGPSKDPKSASGVTPPNTPSGTKATPARACEGKGECRGGIRPAKGLGALDPGKAAKVDLKRAGMAVISGIIWEKGVASRIDEAQILVYRRKGKKGTGEKVAATYSDRRGNFYIRLAPGRYIVKVFAPGCFAYSAREKVALSERLSVEYFIRRREADPYTTTVVGRRDRKEVTRYTVTLPEIIAIPGTQGDALKAIQNMPGVARTSFGVAGLVIRGASPRDSKVFYEGHEIPQLYHFFGITSVVNSDLLRSIEFVPGNFSSEYGNAMGGVVNVRARKPKSDALHGYLDSDLWDTGVLLEGPLPFLDKGSFAVTYRRSYLDMFLRPFKERIGVAPIYHDYMATIHVPLWGGTLQAMFFGSEDSIVLFEEDMEPYVTNFMKGLVIYSKRVGRTRYRASVSAGESYLQWRDPDDQFRVGYTIRSLDYRLTVTHKFTESFALRGGLTGGVGDIDLWIRVTSTIGKDENGDDIHNPAGNEKFDLAETLYFQGAWLELQWRPVRRFELIPGVRFDFWDGLESREVTANPRLTAIFHAVPKKLRIMAGLGLYTQPPDLFMTHKDFGNPDLTHESSLHTSLGMEWTMAKATSLKLVGFYKHLYDLVASPVSTWTDDGDVEPDAQLATNHGEGRIYGMELLLKKGSTKLCPGFLGFSRCFGWISYTLMKSERRDQSREGWYPFDYDQTHIFTGIISGKWASGWRVGLRFRYTSGNPFTPMAGGMYSIDSNSYYGIPGVINSARLPDFHQLDFRVDKKFTFNRWSFTIYLDIQNLYNQQATEYMKYNFNYTKRGFVHGLPLLPSLGLKGSF